MEPGTTTLTEAARSVHLLKIEGYSATRTVSSSEPIRSTWNVSGYNWEVHFYHEYTAKIFPGQKEFWVALKLVFLGQLSASKMLRANLGCRLVDPSRNLEPSEMKNACSIFCRYGNYSTQTLLVTKSDDVPSSGYLRNDCLTVECTITVLNDLKQVAIPSQEEVRLAMPASDMHQHFSELLQSRTGADVTFTVSGESFAAHKLVLAARSPVFRAEFFGNMEERSSKCVQIKDVEASVFKAMLHFIYTHTAPELDEEPEATSATMAQHLLAAADRYGLDRLKLICEGKLSCSLLKAKCVDFITASPKKLDAVVATEGYKHLVASCPLVLTELLKAARGRKN
ncbi:hypothetical protein EJB05_41892, partial [Eragrostis curvula]